MEKLHSLVNYLRNRLIIHSNYMYLIFKNYLIQGGSITSNIFVNDSDDPNDEWPDITLPSPYRVNQKQINQENKRQNFLQNQINQSVEKQIYDLKLENSLFLYVSQRCDSNTYDLKDGEEQNLTFLFNVINDPFGMYNTYVDDNDNSYQGYLFKDGINDILIGKQFRTTTGIAINVTNINSETVLVIKEKFLDFTNGVLMTTSEKIINLDGNTSFETPLNSSSPITIPNFLTNSDEMLYYYTIEARGGNLTVEFSKAKFDYAVIGNTDIMLSINNPYYLGDARQLSKDYGEEWIDKFGNVWTKICKLTDGQTLLGGSSPKPNDPITNGEVKKHNHKVVEHIRLQQESMNFRGLTNYFKVMSEFNTFDPNGNPRIIDCENGGGIFYNYNDWYTEKNGAIQNIAAGLYFGKSLFVYECTNQINPNFGIRSTSSLNNKK